MQLPTPIERDPLPPLPGLGGTLGVPAIMRMDDAEAKRVSDRIDEEIRLEREAIKKKTSAIYQRTTSYRKTHLVGGAM